MVKKKKKKFRALCLTATSNVFEHPSPRLPGGSFTCIDFHNKYFISTLQMKKLRHSELKHLVPSLWIVSK